MGADPGRGRRRGAALVVAVASLLALLLLAHGALLLSLQEEAASRAARRALQARVAAESAVRDAFASGRVDGAPTLTAVPAVFGARGDVEYRAEVRGVGSEAVLVEGRGRVLRGPWGAGMARLGWRLDPLARVAAFAGTVEVGAEASVVLDGAVQGAARDWEVSEATACAPWRARLDSALAAPRPALARVETGREREPALGLLGADRLFGLLTPVPAAVGTPRPSSVLGRCVETDPWNWGDPEPGGACGDLRVGRSARGSLRLEGGTGQGLLVVEGALTLVGARFAGVVLAGGPVILEEGARVEGLVRAGGGLDLDGGSLVVRGACAAVLGLDALRNELGLLVPVPGGWIAPLGRSP